MRILAAVALFLAGLIHLLPLPGVLGAAQLEALYGVPLEDPGLVLLLRHRAVLFALLGVLLVVAAFRRALVAPALVAGFTSVVGFLALAQGASLDNAAIARVVLADWIALALLLVASFGWLWARRHAAEGLPPAVHHIDFAVPDLARSRAFYAQALAPLGLALQMERRSPEGHGVLGFGRPPDPLFWIREPRDGVLPGHLHLAFSAPSRAAVDAFHAAALGAGGRDAGAPGLRPRYAARYYAAYVLDPDGHTIEAVHRG